MRNDLHDEWFFKNPQYFMWWCDLMHLASWKSETVMVGSIPVSLNRGQLIASINDLVKRWDRSKDMIIKYIKVLETKGLIIKTTKNNISIITILDYDLEDDTDNHADYFADNLPVVTTDNHADTPEHAQSTDKQRLSKNLMGKQTDNLADTFPAVTTDNHADNLADSYIIYKEERIKKSTSTTRESKVKKYSLESTTGNNDKSSGNSSAISTLYGIGKLLSDQKTLLLLQRESGFTLEEVMLWIEKFGKKWELSEPTHDNYNHLVKHVQDTLNIKRRKNEKPEKLLINNESTAQEIWNTIQADLCLNHPDVISVLEQLLFYGFNDNTIALLAPSSDIKEEVNDKYIGLINKQIEKYSDSPIKVKCGTLKVKEK